MGRNYLRKIGIVVLVPLLLVGITSAEETDPDTETTVTDNVTFNFEQKIAC